MFHGRKYLRVAYMVGITTRGCRWNEICCCFVLLLLTIIQQSTLMDIGTHKSVCQSASRCFVFLL